MQISLMYLLLTQSEGNIDHRCQSCPSRFASMSERLVVFVHNMCATAIYTHHFCWRFSSFFASEKPANRQQKLSRSSIDIGRVYVHVLYRVQYARTSHTTAVLYRVHKTVIVRTSCARYYFTTQNTYHYRTICMHHRHTVDM